MSILGIIMVIYEILWSKFFITLVAFGSAVWGMQKVWDFLMSEIKTANNRGLSKKKKFVYRIIVFFVGYGIFTIIRDIVDLFRQG